MTGDGVEWPRELRRYRVRLFGRPMGLWRATKEEAHADAVARKLGSREPWDRVTYLNVGVDIESSAPTEDTERDVRAREGLREVADLGGRARGLAAAKARRRPEAPPHTAMRRRSSTG